EVRFPWPVLRFNGIRRLALFVFSLLTLAPALQAQTTPVTASVTGTSGAAQCLRGAARPFILRRGDSIQADDVITTGASARVVISLSDGSQIIIAPNSRVVMKDFRTPTSLRELLEITVGRVRLKIRRLNNQPNPYRLNSPAATIAVRGTEFLVAVASSGETQVSVSEGLVEVSSRIDPQQSRLLTPGKNVIVRATGDISLNLPGPGSGARGQVATFSDQALTNGSLSSFYSILFNSEATHNRYVGNLIEPSLNAAPLRYAAFADSHFDSLINPAYATEFKRDDGRLYLLPSGSDTFRTINSTDLTRAESIHPFDYTGAVQLSYFTPINARTVIGGSASIARVNQQSFALNELRGNVFQTFETLSGAVKNTTANVSLIAARSLGTSERSSLGLALEHLTGRGSFFTYQSVLFRDLRDGWEAPSSLVYSEQSRLARTRATVGMTHTLRRGQKFGVFYRHGITCANSGFHIEEEHIVFNNHPIVEDQKSRSSELGLRWREHLSRRWFYGLEASLLGENLSRSFQYEFMNHQEASNTRRATFGGGLGFAPRPQTVFSLDVAAGARRAEREYSSQFLTRNRVSERYSDKGQFFNWHLGAQTEFKRKLLFNASLLTLSEWDWTDNRLHSSLPAFRPNGPVTYYFSNFGTGWRMRSDWLFQYVFSVNYGHRASSHTFVLRHDFRFRREH
ncbi:MAG TPA: FecR domain-containing protein, partial [Blastocatellia bacterium]|nr:FecR domain-containing protein [Blastocatellia bacterium]